MELETIKQLIQDYTNGHSAFVMQAAVGERYYRNDTDIKHKPKKECEDQQPLRNADNRISYGFHGLLVNQKAAYAFTDPPLFDVGNKQANQAVVKALGDYYAKNCMELCVNAANTGVGWVHYWVDRNNTFQWAVANSMEIVPVFDHAMRRRLLAVLRCYCQIDETDNKLYRICEYWDDTVCYAYRYPAEEHGLDLICGYPMFTAADTYGTEGDPTNVYHHDFGTVPFVPFWNNNIHTSDLYAIKALIDVYDKVYSGFINDLDDIQELIFVLSGYGGQDLQEFLEDLKKYKTIDIDDDGGVSTLSIQIPLDARKAAMESTRKAIFEQGMGFDPTPDRFGDQSGEALKFMYAPLEMKVGLMETEFRTGFAELIRAICQNLHIKCDTIRQTWTRTKIRNDTELAEICRSSVGIVSERTILANHPLVDDVEAELKQLKKEKAQNETDSYNGAFPNQPKEDEDDT